MKVLVTGANGQVGHELAALLQETSWDVQMPLRRELDLQKTASIHDFCARFKPNLIVNAAAYTAVDKAETDKDAAFAINADALKVFAEYARAHDAAILHISTDYVFDGAKTDALYAPDAAPAPLNVYGASKLQGELYLKETCDKYLILRTAWVFSIWGNNFVKAMLNLAKSRDELGIVADQTGGPTSAKSIALACLKLAQAYEKDPGLAWGTYHFTGREATTWCDFAKAIFEAAQKEGSDKIPTVKAITTADYPTPAARPKYSVLDCSLLEQNFQISQPYWKDDMAQVVHELLKGES